MKIIIVGCERSGAELALSLSRAGHSVTVVDPNAAAFSKLGPDFRGSTVAGIGFDRDVLAQAGIEKSDALAAFTESDESNAVTARIAREIYHVPKVVARLYDRGKAEIYKQLGIQTLSSTTWSIKRAVDLLTYSPLDAVFSFGNGDVELLKIEVPSLIAGRKVDDLTVPGDIHVAAIERGEKTLLPTGGTIFQRHDILYIAAVVSAEGQLKKLLGLGDEKGMCI